MNQSEVKLTPLRQDILAILRASSKPLGAYEVLSRLKKKRPNAEPPTVYRVLDFLIENHLVHRIAAQNAYVCCAHSAAETYTHNAILLSCQKCHKSFEFEEDNIFLAISKFAKKRALKVNDAIIEMKGICPACFAR